MKVEKILGKKFVRGKPYYKIKWEGASKDQSTWETPPALVKYRSMINSYEMKNWGLSLDQKFFDPSIYVNKGFANRSKALSDKKNSKEIKRKEKKKVQQLEQNQLSEGSSSQDEEEAEKKLISKKQQKKKKNGENFKERAEQKSGKVDGEEIMVIETDSDGHNDSTDRIPPHEQFEKERTGLKKPKQTVSNSEWGQGQIINPLKQSSNNKAQEIVSTNINQQSAIFTPAQVIQSQPNFQNQEQKEKEIIQLVADQLPDVEKHLIEKNQITNKQKNGSMSEVPTRKYSILEINDEKKNEENKKGQKLNEERKNQENKNIGQMKEGSMKTQEKGQKIYSPSTQQQVKAKKVFQISDCHSMHIDTNITSKKVQNIYYLEKLSSKNHLYLVEFDKKTMIKLTSAELMEWYPDQFVSFLENRVRMGKFQK